MADQVSAKLFVGKLPPEVTEEDLKDIFEPFGIPVDMQVMSSRPSAAGAGGACAFVTLDSEEAAELAIAALHNKYQGSPGGPKLTVTPHWMDQGNRGSKGPPPAKKEPKVKAKGKKTESDSKAAKAKAGLNDEAATFNPQNPYAGASEAVEQMQQYADFYAAAAYYASAMPQMYGADMWSGAWGAGYPQLGGSGEESVGGGNSASGRKSMPADGKLFVGGLPQAVKESEIRMVFSQVGVVKEVHIMQGGSQSGQVCAFVVYPDAYSAQLAIRTLNKTPWHSAPDANGITVRVADKAGKNKKGGKKQN